MDYILRNLTQNLRSKTLLLINRKGFQQMLKAYSLNVSQNNF